MSDTFLVLRGKLDWAKLTGDARPYRGNPKFDKGPSWSVDLTPDAKSLQLMREHNIDDKLKDPAKRQNDERKEPFLSLKVLKYREWPRQQETQENFPPRVKDAAGKTWTGGLIGNGTVADVKVKVVDYGQTTGVYLQAVRVLEHVPYEVNDFAPLAEDDEFFGDTSGFTETAPVDPLGTVFDTDLNDDVPF